MAVLHISETERQSALSSQVPSAADLLPTSLPALFTMVAMAVLACAIVGLPLGFDGSYYLLKLIDEGVAYVPHNRVGNVILQLPALAAFNLSGQVTPALMAFSFTYAVVPFLALAACYFIVRKHNKALMLWPALSTALASVILGPVMISENLIAAELAWPLILGVITPANKMKTVALFLTALFIATLHPCSVVYLGLASAFAWRHGYGNRPGCANRSWMALSLVAIAVARVACAFAFPAPYESETLSSGSWFNYGFRILVSPLCYVEVYAIACGVLFLKGKNPGGSAPRVRLLKIAVGVTVLALAIAFLWSGEIKMWDHCFFAGRFIFVPVSALTICAMLDNKGGVPQTTAHAERVTWYRVALTNLAFLGILCCTLAQCTTWLDVRNRTEYALRHSDSAIIDIDAQQYPFGTPLAHWSIGSYSILLQGRQPSKVMLKSDAVAAAKEKGIYTINSIEPPLSCRWFKLPAASGRTQ